MKRMKRMLSAVLAAAVMAAGFALTSFASDSEEAAGKVEKAAAETVLCADCGVGQVVVEKEFSRWLVVDRTPCTHKMRDSYWLWDEVQERSVTARYTACDHCGVQQPSLVTKEQRIVHHES